MRIVTWTNWLDQHIPYYEAEKHRGRFLDNPPQVVLIIYPHDDIRNTEIPSVTAARWRKWDMIAEDIVDRCRQKACPMFLERDSNQQWYWAFWDQNDALMSVICMT